MDAASQGEYGINNLNTNQKFLKEFLEILESLEESLQDSGGGARTF